MDAFALAAPAGAFAETTLISGFTFRVLLNVFQNVERVGATDGGEADGEGDKDDLFHTDVIFGSVCWFICRKAPGEAGRQSTSRRPTA
jgi:hypothetical protein